MQVSSGKWWKLRLHARYRLGTACTEEDQHLRPAQAHHRTQPASWPNSHCRMTEQTLPAAGQVEAQSSCSLEERHGLHNGPGCSSLDRFEDLVRRLYGQVSVRNLVGAMSSLRKLADVALAKRGVPACLCAGVHEGLDSLGGSSS